MSALRYAILIPARDEAQALPGLFDALSRATASKPNTVLVVDNGSCDATADVARARGAAVIHEPRPGYGAACRAGIDWLERHRGPEALVFLDADDFSAPAQLETLLSPIEAGEADLVVGERVSRRGGGVRWHARWGNRLVLAVLSARYGSRVTDMGPFRAIRWEVLRALALDDPDYGWYVQMQVRALRSGFRVVGRPVRFDRRTVGRSKVSGSARASVRAGWVMLRTLAVEMLRRRDGARPEPRRD